MNIIMTDSYILEYMQKYKDATYKAYILSPSIVDNGKSCRWKYISAIDINVRIKLMVVFAKKDKIMPIQLCSTGK